MHQPPASDPRKGVTLGALGGLAISFDIPVIRLAGADPWMTLCVRGLCLAGLFALIAMWTRRGRNGAARTKWKMPDRDWLLVGVFYGISNVFFTLGVYYTTTANLVFLLAFNSLLAAIFGWWLIGERPLAPTWAAIAATIAGVMVIVAGGFGDTANGFANGTIRGDLCALGAASFLALALVFARRSGQDMSLAPGLGGLLAALFAVPFIWAAPIWPEAIEWLFFNGLVVVPIAAFCLALAPRYISAPHAAMFYLVETVLAPIWVWLTFGEIVTLPTLAGGAIVLGAVAAHSWWSLQRKKRVPGMAMEEPA